MLRLRFAIVWICAMIAFQAAAQTSNPFDLKWKSGDTPPARDADTADNSSEVSIAPPSPEIASVDTKSRTPILAAPALSIGDSLLETDPAADSSSFVDRNPARIPPVVVNPDSSEPVEPAKTPGDDTPDTSTTNYDAAQESVISDPNLPGQTRNVGVMLIITMLGLSILVLTWAVNANRGFLRKIYRAAMNENLSGLLLREQKFASLQYLYYIVYATFFINASLFLFLISRYSGWELGNARTPLLLFLGVLVGIYLTRHLFMRILGSTFRIETETTHYNFNILLYNILAGIALIPVNLFIAFAPESTRMPVIYAGLGLLGILYLLRQLRGINMVSHLIVGHVFQFFIYLCAVEILPVLVLFKYFITD